MNTLIGAPVGEPWMWGLSFGHHENRSPHGYAATREAAVASVRQELAAGMNLHEKRRQSWAGGAE